MKLRLKSVKVRSWSGFRVLVFGLLCTPVIAQTNWQQISDYNFGVSQRIEQQRQAAGQMDQWVQQQQQPGYGEAYAGTPSSYDWLARQIAVANDEALRKRDYTGALAYNLEQGRWYWQLGADTVGKALYELGQQCPMAGCPLVAVFHNTCLAAAHNGQHGYFWGDAVKPGKAQAAALANCRAKGHQDCVAVPELAICTGYRYLDSPEKMNRFQRGGLIGVFAPSAAGIAQSPPPRVIYNPRMQLYQALPATEQQQPEARQGALGASPLWAAFGLSPSTSKLSFEMSLTRAGAEAAARASCGARDCLIAQYFQDRTCITSGIGRNPAGQGMFFLQLGTDQQHADLAMQQECDKAQASCEVKLRRCLQLS